MRDRWEILPELNVARYNHSSCTLGKTLYVLGGLDHDNEYVDSIEKLTNIDEPELSKFSRWQLFQPNSFFYKPRIWPVFCALNKREMIILGGKEKVKS